MPSLSASGFAGESQQRRKVLKASMRVLKTVVALFPVAAILMIPSVQAQNSNFHNAPASAGQLKNPYADQAPSAGKQLFHQRCARCHGENGEGSGNIPALAKEKIKSAAPGELFWFITQGDVNNGMPSWAALPKRQRWLIVNYVEALGKAQSGAAPSAPAAAQKAAILNAPPPPAPFTDYRYEKPGKIRK